MTSRPAHSDSADTPNCCVVRFSIKKGGKDIEPTCAGMSTEALDGLRDATKSWRDPKHVVRRLEALRQREQLPGLVLWYNLENHAMDTPAPLGVPFEPYELNEGRSPLADLIGSSAAVADPEAVAAMRSSRSKRALARLGIPAILLLSTLPNAITQIAIHRDPATSWIWAAPVVLMVLAAAIVWWLSDQWLLVPGGVVIRKTMVGKVGESLKLCTPANSMLIIRPQQSFFSLELWQGSHVKKRQATKLEAAALLAAWQSPIPPPDPDRLSDLG